MLRNISAFIGIGILLTGCGATMESKLDNLRSGYIQNNSPEIIAKQFSGGVSDFKDMDNLELLIVGDALFRSNQFKESDEVFQEFNRREPDITGFNLGDEAATLLAGNMATDYRPFMMDTLFVSYYQLWDAIALGDMNTARVIINQSYAKQKEMSIAYDSLIKETLNNTIDDANNTGAIGEIQNRVKVWKSYDTIMNPALTYLSGIYFLNMGEYNDAKLYLERSFGMMPNNSFIKSDLKHAEQNKRPNNTAWIFIEDSFAPKLKEELTEIPWIIDYNLTLIPIFYSEPVFYPNDNKYQGSKLLADVDAMFMTEYRYYQVNEMIRTLISAASKTALQSAMYNSGSEYSSLMGLGATLYAYASSSAEVRTWASLPKNIWLLRVDKPSNGVIELKTSNGTLTEIDVPYNGNHIIYVRPNKLAVDTKIIKIK